MATEMDTMSCILCEREDKAEDFRLCYICGRDICETCIENDECDECSRDKFDYNITILKKSINTLFRKMFNEFKENQFNYTTGYGYYSFKKYYFDIAIKEVGIEWKTLILD
jgi:hypothetical protein